MLSQHFCQVLAAEAFPNCAATLDKMRAASLITERGNTKTIEPSDLLWFVIICYSLKPHRNTSDGRCDTELVVGVRGTLKVIF